MIGPVRVQGDARQREFSLLCRKDCSLDPLLTRQEMAEETDINVIMRRVGAGQAVSSRPLKFGVMDFDIDLLSFRTSVDYAFSVYERLPDSVRSRYPSWQQFVAAVVSGQFRADAEAAAGADSKSDQPSPQGAAGSSEEPPKGA